jgi:hypothetical protein
LPEKYFLRCTNHEAFYFEIQQRDFSLQQTVQTDSGAHSPSWIKGDSSLGVKQLGLEVDHSPQSGAELKIEWNYTPTSLICLYLMQFPPVPHYFIPLRYKHLPVENPQSMPLP